MNKRFINPPALHRPVDWTHVVTARAGTTVYVSGQVSADASGALVGAGDITVQARTAFENLKVALEAAGATLDDLVAYTMMVVDVSPERVDLIHRVRRDYVSQHHPPSCTLIGVTSLCEPGWLIEVNAIAVIDD